MKLWLQDGFREGAIMVIAESKEEAIKMMEKCRSYKSNHEEYPIQEIAIRPGVVYNNIGDL